MIWVLPNLAQTDPLTTLVKCIVENHDPKEKIHNTLGGKIKRTIRCHNH